MRIGLSITSCVLTAIVGLLISWDWAFYSTLLAVTALAYFTSTQSGR